MVGRDELLVLVDDGTSEAAFLDDNGSQDKARANLDKIQLGFGGARFLGRDLDLLVGGGGGTVRLGYSVLFLAGLGLVDLITPDPDLSGGNGEGHDMVNKGLGLAGGLGDAKLLSEELLDEFEMGLRVESGVKGQDRTGSLEAVAGEMQLLHGVQVLHVELDRGAVWRLAHPDVEILALAGLEEADVVAVVEIGKFVELVEFGFCVELGVFPAVRQKRVQVIEEMAVSGQG